MTATFDRERLPGRFGWSGLPTLRRSGAIDDARDMTPTTLRFTRLATGVAVAALLLAGCGDDDSGSEDDPLDSTTTESTTTTTEPPSTSSSTTTSSTTTSSTTTSSTTTSSTTTTEAPPDGPLPGDQLPGEAFDLSPASGDVLAVVGVRFDDVLNVRRAPGTDQAVVAELAPTADDAVATGRARMLTSSIWWEVTTADGVVGWIGSGFTAKTGATFDTTASVIDELGYRPEEATMSDLGLLVVDTVDRDPDVPSSIVMSVEADETGDLGEVTFDLVGLGDDSTRAVRLHVFGEPLPSGDGFALRAVEQTDMCDPVRGPTEPDGICA